MYIAHSDNHLVKILDSIKAIYWLIVMEFRLVYKAQLTMTFHFINVTCSKTSCHCKICSQDVRGDERTLTANGFVESEVPTLNYHEHSIIDFVGE